MPDNANQLNTSIAPQLAKPDLTTVMEAALQSAMINFNCCKIGIIQSFDAENQTATVQISIKQIISTTPQGIQTIQTLPLLVEVPVIVISGGTSYLSMPIAENDNCLVFFSDTEIDQWLYEGDNQIPITERIHDLSDGLALVGVKNFLNSINDYIANGVRLAFSANSRITFTDNAIDSIAGLFTHTGDMKITGGLEVGGDISSISGGAVNISVDFTQTAGKTLSAGNGVSGTFTNSVTVLNGIVTAGT